MLTRRAFIASAGTLALSAAADAAEQSAQDFVAAIYAKYKGRDTKGIPLDNAAMRRRYFTPALAKLIEDDSKAAAKRKEVPNLDGDPFVDAQEWEIGAVAIDVKETTPGKALAAVKFRNRDKDVSVELDLVKLRSGWRIDEIRAPSGSLRALLKRK